MLSLYRWCLSILSIVIILLYCNWDIFITFYNNSNIYEQLSFNTNVRNTYYIQDIHIFMSSDQTQKIALYTCINSIIINHNTNRKIHFHILVEFNAQQHIKEINILFNTYISEQMIQFEIKQFSNYPKYYNNIYVKSNIKSNKYIFNPMNFARCYFTHIFDLNLSSIHKAIYLDIDMIVQTDIQLLYSNNVNDFIPIQSAYHKHEYEFKSKRLFDIAYKKKSIAKLLNITKELNSNKEGFNTGIYLYDLNFWINNNLTTKCNYYIKLNRKHKGRLWKLGTQPLINLLYAHENIGKLSHKWNVRHLGVKNRSLSESLIKHGYVLHWNGKYKPWLKHGNYKQYWRKYLPKAFNQDNIANWSSNWDIPIIETDKKHDIIMESVTNQSNTVNAMNAMQLQKLITQHSNMIFDKLKLQKLLSNNTKTKNTFDVWLVSTIGFNQSYLLLPYWIEWYKNIGIKPEHFLLNININYEKDDMIKFDRVINFLNVSNITNYHLWTKHYTSTKRKATEEKLINVKHKISHSDYIMIADIDEYQDWNAVGVHNIYDFITNNLTVSGTEYVTAKLMDRFAYNARLMDPVSMYGCDTMDNITDLLFEQYPFVCDFTTKIMTGQTNKICLYKNMYKINTGRHWPDKRISKYKGKKLHIVNGKICKKKNVTCGESKLRYKEFRINIHHFKWQSGVIDYLEKRTEYYKQLGYGWYKQSKAAVRWLKKHSGNVDLQNVKEFDCKLTV
eukprot:202829_1